MLAQEQHLNYLCWQIQAINLLTAKASPPVPRFKMFKKPFCQTGVLQHAIILPFTQSFHTHPHSSNSTMAELADACPGDSGDQDDHLHICLVIVKMSSSKGANNTVIHCNTMHVLCSMFVLYVMLCICIYLCAILFVLNYMFMCTILYSIRHAHSMNICVLPPTVITYNAPKIASTLSHDFNPHGLLSLPTS